MAFNEWNTFNVWQAASNPTVSGSATMPLFTVSGSLSATVTPASLSAAVTMPVMTVAGEVSATQPTPDVSGNVTMPMFTVNCYLSATTSKITVTPETNIFVE